MSIDRSCKLRLCGLARLRRQQLFFLSPRHGGLAWSLEALDALCEQVLLKEFVLDNWPALEEEGHETADEPQATCAITLCSMLLVFLNMLAAHACSTQYLMYDVLSLGLIEVQVEPSMIGSKC